MTLGSGFPEAKMLAPGCRRGPRRGLSGAGSAWPREEAPRTNTHAHTGSRDRSCVTTLHLGEETQ